VPARLLGLFASPLDGILLCGGTFARYSGAGVETAVALAAETPPHPALAAVRLLGVRHLFLLGFEAGELAELPPQTLGAVLADVMSGVEAQVVLTTAPGMGGPDRAAVTEAVGTAFRARRDHGVGPGGRPLRLYQAALPQRQARALAPLLAPAGASPGGTAPGAVRDSGLTAIVDVRAQAQAKLAALRALLEGSPFPPGLEPDLLGHEFFRRAEPEPWVSGIVERDLLGGIADPHQPAAPPARMAG
jgi:LmbE family N-acetylglucosaminyl deacetylase